MFNPYIILGTAGAWLISLAVVGWLMYARGHDDMRNTMNEQNLKQTQEVLAQFSKDAAGIHGAAQAYVSQRSDVDAKFAALSKDLKNATKAKPLPVDCKPDAGRVRSLAAAISAANSAIGRSSGAAMPANP